MSLIAIRHPETGGVSVQSQDQIDMLYTVRGWEPIAIDPAFATSVIGVPISDLAELDMDQIKTVIAAFDAQKPVDRKVQLEALTVLELQDILEGFGEPTTGKKSDLVDRVLAHEKAVAGS